MAIIKCKMCGGDLNIIEGASTAECEFCGSVQTIPNLDDEKKLIQFERAERLRKQCEFDKAAGIYETIVADFRQEAEAYWGLVLCKFGIEYVDDPATGKKIPTCHRSSFDSIMEDSDFEQALENADVMARRVYRDEAKQIEEIRKGIIAVSANEEPYDIFICYKETAENGDRTLDSVLAQDVYDALTDKGYRVFFSRISLEDKLGVEYEPYIFAALNSAKIMLAFGTDYEYFNAVWVKNEWSRFLKLMAKDKEKHLIPCYKGIDAYDMPKEFAKLQAQDLGKVGAIQDLLRGIAKILPLQKETVVVQQTVAANNPTIDSLLKRAFMFLEDGDWSGANEYCEKVLDIDPECAEAYLGKLMAELKVQRKEDLKNQEEPFVDNANYKKAVHFAGDALRSTLEGYIAGIKKRIEEERIAQEKREEEERFAKEQKAIAQKVKLKSIREKLRPAQNLLFTNFQQTVGLKSDGTVVAVGKNDYGQCNVAEWRDIVSISSGEGNTAGLKRDGTVVVVGENRFGQRNVTEWREVTTIFVGLATTIGVKSDGTVVTAGCDEEGWSNIIDISTNYNHTVGLKSDGTVVAVGENDYGQCNVAGWRDIVAISAADEHTVGLKSDGTVVAVGENDYGQCNVAEWSDIIAISANYNHTVGLKSDGTVVAVGENDHGQCNVAEWREIVAISAADEHTVGLKSDGTVVAVGENADGQCNVDEWSDIIAISANYNHTVGLKFDGTVVAVGDNKNGQCEVTSWQLFKDFENLESERETEHLARQKFDEEEKNARLKREEEERIAREKQEEEERIACKKRAEEERIASEQNARKLAPIREKIRPAQNLLACGEYHSVGLKSDGTVVAVGDNGLGRCNVTAWHDIVAVSACSSFFSGHTVGLKSDGTVVAVGNNLFGQCDVTAWRGIVAISAGVHHTVGLKSDGTVVTVGGNEDGQCNVTAWRDIVAISAGGSHTVGLKSDGTVVAVGDNGLGRCNVSAWKGIVAICAGYIATYGLKSDGTVVSTYQHEFDEKWRNIVAISFDGIYPVGLRADGTVVTDNKKINEVTKWRNIVAISVGKGYVLGLRSDGTVAYTEYNGDADDNYGQCNVSGWKLFNDLDNLEAEKQTERVKRNRRDAGLCQHCGGQLKGLFSKKCVSCGKLKDY